MAFFDYLPGEKEVFRLGAASAASGISWLYETADDSKQTYLDFIRRAAEPEIIQQQLEAVAELAPLSPDAKGLEHGGTDRSAARPGATAL